MMTNKLVKKQVLLNSIVFVLYACINIGHNVYFHYLSTKHHEEKAALWQEYIYVDNGVDSTEYKEALEQYQVAIKNTQKAQWWKTHY